jgi:glutathione synthase/RimK-type ligase-like ATP-grasp enzyme
MSQCAFLSIANTDGWFIDDDLVHEPLRRLGWNVSNIPWNKTTDWDKYDMVIIRSPWDYQDHLDNFLKVLDDIENSRTILFNDLNIVRWNINKSYLFDLKRKGIELIPTMKLSSPGIEDFMEAFDRWNEKEVIIKPLVGANADDTFRMSKDQPDLLEEITLRFRQRECLIQPFEVNVVQEGEFSVMYFGGMRAHTILKTAGKGDYRVQEEHGGGVLPVPEPETDLLRTADKVMEALPFAPLYARVDLVRTTENTFALMELELIEPALYFRFDPDAPFLFAACADQFWKRSQHMD